MKIAIAVFDRCYALDVVGPYNVLCYLPGAEVMLAAESLDPVWDDVGRMAFTPTARFDDLPDPDVLVVPGSPFVDDMLADTAMRAWVTRAHEATTWTTSVCTGAFVLGAAGVLEGRRATTHWSRLARLAEVGAVPTGERVVADGKVLTSAGVSAGIDMALTLAARLAGDDIAQAIQLGLEYDPEPPFAAGSPDTAPAHVTALVQEMLTGPSAQNAA